MVKKPVYQPAKNITISETRVGKWRVGNCKLCGKRGIRSCKWSEHQHPQWSENHLGNETNTRFVESLLQSIKNTLLNQGIRYLNTYFPKGVGRQTKNKIEADIKQNLINILKKSQISREILLIPQSNLQSAQKISVIVKQQGDFTGNTYQQGGDQALASKAEAQFKKMNKGDKQKILTLSNLKELYQLKQYSTEPKTIKLRDALMNYQSGHKQLKKLINRKEYSQERSIFNLLKMCYVCSQNFSEENQKYLECSLCQTRIHLYCIYRIEVGCVCRLYEVRSITDQKKFEREYKEPKDIKDTLFLSTQFLRVGLFQPQASRKSINQAEKAFIQILRKRNYNNYVTQARFPASLKISSSALTDPFLRIASPQFEKVYEAYSSGKYKAPVRPIYLREDNFGVEAIDDIPSNSFLCEYACDILPMACLQRVYSHNQIMVYLNGPTSQTDLVLVPANCSNWAPLINHAVDKHSQNCSSLRLIVRNKVRVIIYSIKKIAKGEQLLYNYNGFFQEYQTAGFEKYTSS